MNRLKRGWRSILNRLNDPLEDAVSQSKQGWSKLTARNREAPPVHTFSLHLLRAGLSWATRLGFDRDAGKAIKRSVRRLHRLVMRWPQRVRLLVESYDARRESGKALDEHRAAHGKRVARNVLVLILATAAVVLLATVDLPFVEGAMEMLIDDPTKSVLGVKVISLAAWGFVIGIAGAAKLSAGALRRIFAGEVKRSDVALLALCVTLVLGSIVAFADPRQEAIEGSSGGTTSSVTVPGEEPTTEGPEDDGAAFPWLLVLLGATPFLFGTVLLAGAQNPAAEAEMKLWGKHLWAGLRTRWNERKFGRLQVGVDRSERRIIDALLELKRAIGEEEASRLVHAEGYRFSEEWNGWLTEMPKLLETIKDAAPGALPSFAPHDLARLNLTAEDMVNGSQIRQALEREFGNPLADSAREVRAERDPVGRPATRASRNGGSSQDLDEQVAES
jgi:hypothetical protein